MDSEWTRFEDGRSAGGSLEREGVVMERRILFVEDDASFRELFARAMREALATEPASTSRSSRLALRPRRVRGLGRGAGRRADQHHAARRERA